MNLFEDFNYNISEIRENIGKIARKVESSSKQIKDQAQLKMEIAKAEHKLKQLYQNLGEKTYKEYIGEEVEINIEEAVKSINIVKAQLEGLNKRVEYLKTRDSQNDYKPTNNDNKYLEI